MFSFGRRKKKEEKQCAIKVQSLIRGYLCKRQYQILLSKKKSACITIQKNVRGTLDRSLLNKQKMYIVKVQAVFRGQSLRRRLARVDPLALPISHFKDFRQKRNKQGLYKLMRKIDHCGTGYLTLEELYYMVTDCITIPMPHGTAKRFVNMIRASLLKGSKDGMYSIPRIIRTILNYKVKQIPHQLRHSRFDKRPSHLRNNRVGNKRNEVSIDMAALPPYLFSNQVKHKANTLVLPSMVNPVSKNRRHENKTDTKRIPSPPKETKSPKSKEKPYVCVWDKILADDGETFYYYNTFTRQSQWKCPPRGIIREYNHKKYKARNLNK